MFNGHMWLIDNIYWIIIFKGHLYHNRKLSDKKKKLNECDNCYRSKNIMQKWRTKLCGCGGEILARTALDDGLSGKVNFE